MNAEADTSDSQIRNRTCDKQKLIVVQSCCGSPDFCGSSLSCFLPQNKELGTCFSPGTSGSLSGFKSLSGSIYFMVA